VGSSLRTFVVVPLVVLVWELLVNHGTLRFEPWFLPLMIWGYLQYRLVGRYRISLGGGGPGMKTMPERLVTAGPYAYTRNPMYLGHIIFLAGLALTLRSELAAVIAVASAVFFHFRVKKDEKRLREYFGGAYAEYCARVKRWIPGLL
jgi:protein-S-isoprenylcysteine O-methyltransferase Ste14